MAGRDPGEPQGRRLTAIDWERPIGDAWYLMTARYGWTAGGPVAHVDWSLWAPHRFAGERRFSFWDLPPEKRVFCAEDARSGIVNVLYSAQGDYLVEYQRWKREKRK